MDIKGNESIILIGIILFLNGCTDSNTNIDAISVYFVSKYFKYQTTF